MKDRSKSAKMSGRKGRRAEYEVRDILQPIFYPNDEGKVLRTPGSGTWGGIQVMTGDLVCVKDDKMDERLPFYWQVRIRARREFAPYLMMSGKFGLLEDWWRELLEKAPKDHIPMLVWRPDDSPWFLFMDRAHYELFGEDFGSIPPIPYAVLECLNRRLDEDRYKGWVNMTLENWIRWFQASDFFGGGK